MYKNLKLALGVLAILSPIGLIAEGTAWGEWGAEEMESSLGFVPEGMQRFSDWWQALFPDYVITLFGESSLGHSAGYILSAIIGSLLVYGGTILLTKFLLRQKSKAAFTNK